ncbi:dihydromonapterin reductase/dihydrofolate reductase [Natronocella acetinitrilica]|uniref:Dihydromonapterin reductase n=1 Tax=Natronocella acetinitrilica TaxID=414046 RepID=A0AAE3G7M4_9GAMM|nr:dihydromonapterin reductase [Natronocella acetinitrilica]MCP1676538.1 dihydromonapterin reductase/dihydrofolate reductase [Natronocella acetinitrilica]
MQAPVLITGAAQRTGLHLARRFMEEGQPVVMTYRRRRPLIDELAADGVICLQADFTTTAGIFAFIDALQRQVTDLRAVIHNASTWSPDAPGEAGARQFADLFHVHMQAPYLINMACRDLLEASDRPADIIHFTDFVVNKGSSKHAAYAATKAGLDNLTRSFAAMFAPRIKVNAIAPALLEFNEGDDEAYRQKARGKSALGIVPGFEVAYQTVRYLMDNSYVTGATLPLDGGRGVR